MKKKMSALARVILSLRVKQCKAYVSPKLVHFTQNESLHSTVNSQCRTNEEALSVNERNKCNYNVQNFGISKQHKYTTRFQRFVNIVSKFEEDVNKKCIPIINRMCYIHHNKSLNESLYAELQKFIKTYEFRRFCSFVHKNLRQLHPDGLLVLLNMEYFGISVESPFMQKTLTLILNNINYYSPMDKVHLYIKVSKKYFENSKESENIRKALKVYFDEVFESEMSLWVTTKESALLLQDELLPVKIKSLIAQKILDDTLAVGASKIHICVFVESIFLQPIPLFPDYVAIELLRKCNYFKPLHMSIKFMELYKKVVEQHDSLYDERMCDSFILEANLRIFFSLKKVAVLDVLCFLGYLNDDFLKNVSESILILNLNTLIKPVLLKVVGCLVRTCIHERDILSAENWMAIKNMMDSHKIAEDWITTFAVTWCEYLTFLGCDTRNLFTHIFERIAEDSFSDFDDCVCIPRFHNLAQVYFPGGFKALPDKRLANFLKISAVRNPAAPPGLIDFLGGEDFLLQNCTTSNKHFLHYVAVLGPDNKPVNLSSFKKKFAPITPSKEFLYNLEDIEKPTGSKIIVFQNFLDKQPIKFRNAPVMSGVARIYLKSFENLDCDVVLLPSSKFEKISPEAQSEYLKSQINEIIEKHSQPNWSQNLVSVDRVQVYDLRCFQFL